jgi:hypothetical protein
MNENNAQPCEVEFDYFQWLELGEHEHDFSAEAVCVKCESAPGHMLTECPGTVLTAYQKGRVGRGRLDYINGDWKQKITVPRAVGTMDEIIKFLEADAR